MRLMKIHIAFKTLLHTKAVVPACGFICLLVTLCLLAPSVAQASYHCSDPYGPEYVPSECADSGSHSTQASEDKKIPALMSQLSLCYWVLNVESNPLSLIQARDVSNWDSYRVNRNFVTEAKRRGYTPESCARALIKGVNSEPLDAQFSEAFTAYEEGDFETVFRNIQPLAEQGNYLAQAMLGELYLLGLGAPKDNILAIKWLTLAADQEVPVGSDMEKKVLKSEILTNLCFLYSLAGTEQAKDVPQSDKESLKWCELSAKEGNPLAQDELAQLYLSGKGTDEDIIKSLKWFALAAEQGVLRGQYVLCQALSSDSEDWLEMGVVRDLRTAQKWCELAAKQGDAGAQLTLGKLYWNGKGGKKDRNLAAKWYRLAAEGGVSEALAAEVSEAQYVLGLLYVGETKVLPKDLVMAHMWLHLSASADKDETSERTEWRDKIEKDMNPSQIKTAQDLARKCKEKSYRGCVPGSPAPQLGVISEERRNCEGFRHIGGPFWRAYIRALDDSDLENLPKDADGKVYDVCSRL